jgi:hypothetical protein
MAAKKAKVDRKDWRNLPLDQWNTATVLAYFADMNREQFGVEQYVPMRNWAFERALVKRALDQYGAEILRQAFDECFRTYRPTREYPILTAGFCVAYRINAIIPRLQAEKAQREKREEAQKAGPGFDEVMAWL